MKERNLVQIAQARVSDARSTAEMVAAHGQDVVQTGIETLQAARTVVKDAGREAIDLLTRTNDNLRKTLKEGVDRVGGKISRIATPTHKEQAEARKAEIKAKKRAKAEQARAEAEQEQPEETAAG